MKPVKQKKQQGFTLIELMIVVGIIGVLSAIAIPAYQSYIQRTEVATAVSTVRSLLTNIDMEEQETGSFPSTLAVIGASANMNPMGTIAIDDTAQTIDFTWGANNAIAQNETVTFTKNATTGWSCALSSNIPAEAKPKSCN